MSQVLCYVLSDCSLICPECATEAETSEEEPGVTVVLRSDEWAPDVIRDGSLCVRCAAVFEDGEFQKK